MIWNVLLFELNYWKKRPITYIFPLIVFIISLLIFTIENVSMGSDVVYRNAPYSLTMMYYIFSMFLPLFLNSFVSSGITRDYENKFDQILYSLPIHKRDILIGRFIGGCFVVSFIFLGIILADLIAPYMPWYEAEILGPFRLDSHIQSYWMMAFPNILIIGSLLFLIASWTKNLNQSFLGAIVIVVVFLSFDSLLDKIDSKTIVSLADPFGIHPIFYITKKWTAFEKNTFLLQLDWKYLANRAIWIGVALFSWVMAFRRNKKRSPKIDNRILDSDLEKKTVLTIPVLKKSFQLHDTVKNIHFQACIDFLHIVKSPAFIVVIGLIIMILSITIVGMVQTDDGLSNQMATTTNALQLLGSINFMMNLGIIYFAGMLVWKERDHKANEIYDSLPVKTYAIYIGKLISVLYLLITIGFIILGFGLAYQLVNGVTNIDWTHYFISLFVTNIFNGLTLCILTMLFQIILNNKYMAYFVSCIILIAEPFLLEWIDISSNLFGISPRLPSVIHSDFYGYGIFKASYFSFMLYWAFVYGLIAYFSILLFVRGKLNTWKERIQEGMLRFRTMKFSGLTLIVLSALMCGFLYYQTKVVNTYFSQKETLTRLSYYEKTFKKLKNYPRPKITHVDYKIDLYPSKRAYNVHSEWKMIHTSDTSIDKLYVNNDLRFPYSIQIEGAKLIKEDKESTVNFQTYQFDKPILKGDSLHISYDYYEHYEGIENEITNNRLVSNGSFIDFSSFTPMLGYQDDLEISDKSDREKYGLLVKAENMPPLERECTSRCSEDYIGGLADWATIHTIISTDPDQMAIAPGKQERSWKDKDRNFYEYNLSQPSKFFFSILSGKYEVLKDTTHGVSCEVYYIPEHAMNTKVMLNALKKSIAYYSDHFGAYRHEQARIIEYPRFGSFAQAFPGTMPYSESIGFTANIVKNPHDINEVFHIVSHEMAHQWWAHQVTGANMQGATLLSESLSEYSSLKLLEKEYGLDMATKFLKESNNGYVFSRAMEAQKESALFQDDAKGYIHYQKGSIILYGIQQLIGEYQMNQALNSLVQKYAYKNPPYPTSYALLDELYARIPDSFKETARDGLERIIIFNSDIKEAKTTKLSNGLYETSIQFSLIKNSSDPNAMQKTKLSEILIGKSEEVAMKDYFDVGLYQEMKDKSRYGKLIQKERFLLTKKDNVLKFVSKIKPDRIVLDPYFIHIHKDPEDNIEKL